MKIARNIMLDEQNVKFLRQFPSMSQYIDDLISVQRDKSKLTSEEEYLNSWLALEKNLQNTVKANQSKQNRIVYLQDAIERLKAFGLAGKGFPSDEKRIEMFEAELEKLLNDKDAT